MSDTAGLGNYVVKCSSRSANYFVLAAAYMLVDRKGEITQVSTRFEHVKQQQTSVINCAADTRDSTKAVPDLRGSDNLSAMRTEVLKLQYECYDNVPNLLLNPISCSPTESASALLKIS